LIYLVWKPLEQSNNVITASTEDGWMSLPQHGDINEDEDEEDGNLLLHNKTAACRRKNTDDDDDAEEIYAL
jgi:hypothetical protein